MADLVHSFELSDVCLRPLQDRNDISDLYLLYVRIYQCFYMHIFPVLAPTMHINKEPTHSSLCLSYRNTTAGGNYIFLGHGSTSPWNFTSGMVPRVKHPKRANNQTGCSRGPEHARSFQCFPLWHSCVCILDILPHTSTQHSKHLPQPPKHLLSTQPGRRVLQHHYAQYNAAHLDGNSTFICSRRLQFDRIAW